MSMTTDMLPEDIILEILARVPDAPALLRCAATCKRWRALVANPPFLRRRWPDPAYYLLGFFAPKNLNGGDEGPTPRSAVAAGHRLLRSFVPDAAGLPADIVYPLTSQDGLLLLRLFNYRPKQTGGVVLAVCNLLAGTCVVLPPFKWGIESVGHAVLTSADCRASFKVLTIVAGKTDYELHTFVAGQPSWSAPTKCLSRAAPKFLIMHTDAVVCQGAAHWLFCESSSFHVLHVDAETGRVSSTKLTSPVSSGPPVDGLDLKVQRGRRRLATTTDGKLLSLCLYDAGLQQVEIWTQPAPAAGHGQDWPRTGVIDLKPILDLEQPQGAVPYVWQLRRRCGNGKLLIMLAYCHAYIANLQTGTMQEVDNMSSSGGYITGDVVGVEIDWTTFFMARLASTRKLITI